MSIILSGGKLIGSAGGLLSTGGSYSTNFPLTENPISEGGAWISGGINPPRTDAQTASNHAYGTMTSFDGTNFDDSIAILSQAFPNNQWVQGTIWNASAPANMEIELVLRGNLTSSNNTGYELDILTSGEVSWVSWNGPDNTFTVLISTTLGTSVNDGDVWYGQIVGTVLTAKCNGVVVTGLTYETSSDAFKIASGSPGMGFWNNTGSSANSPKFGWKSFSAGSL